MPQVTFQASTTKTTTTVLNDSGQKVTKNSYIKYGGGKIAGLCVDESKCKLCKFIAFSKFKFSTEFANDNEGNLIADNTLNLNDTQKMYLDYMNSIGYNNMFTISCVTDKSAVNNLYSSNYNNDNTTESVIFFGDMSEDGTKSAERFMTRVSNTNKVTFTQASISPFRFENETEIKPTLNVRYFSPNGTSLDYNQILGYNVLPQYYINTKYVTAIKNFISNKPELFDLFKDLIAIDYTNGISYNGSPKAFYNSTDGAWFATLKDFYDEIQTNSTNDAEKKIAKNMTWLVGAYRFKWMYECCRHGKLVEDGATYDDIIHYYINYDSDKDNARLTWVNDYFESQDNNIDLQKSTVTVEFHLIEINPTNSLQSVVGGYTVNMSYNDDGYSFSVDDATRRIAPFGQNIFSKYGTYNMIMYAYCTQVDKNGVETKRNTVYVTFDRVAVSDLALNEIAKYGQSNNNNDFIDDISTGTAPDPIDPIENDNEDVDDEPNAPTTPEIDGLNLLTKTYALTKTNCSELGSFLWGDSFADSIRLINSSPLDNIVSCKLIPISASGDVTTIKIGNLVTTVNAKKVNGQITINSGECTLSKHFNNFLDYSPYTNISIYIPFIGFQQLENEYAYTTLKLRYVIDLITGSLCVSLYSDNKIIRLFNGNCSIDIPLSSNNRAQIEASLLANLTSTAITGNVTGMIGSVVDSAITKLRTETSDKPSNNCGLAQVLTPYIIVNRPIINKPTTYAHHNGNKCIGSYYLNTLTGYTVVDSIELTAPCSSSERNEIIALLKNGVYL